MKDILTYIDKNKDVLGIDEYKIDFLQQGEYNINYLITTKDKKFVLRLNSKSQMNLPNQIRYEYE